MTVVGLVALDDDARVCFAIEGGVTTSLRMGAEGEGTTLGPRFELIEDTTNAGFLEEAIEGAVEERVKDIVVGRE